MTFCWSSRLIQARNRGEALKLSGNMRPLEPIKVLSPRPLHQSRKFSGVKLLIIFLKILDFIP